MTRGNVIQTSTTRPVDERTARAVVAAQLRGEAHSEAQVGSRVVAAIATELEASGFVPDLGELGRRYGAPTAAAQLRASA